MIDNKEILDIKGTIRTLAEYVMLNSVATDSTSLYYGRAGMSLCLFETSRYLEDEYVEDYAFTLLKQSLVNEKNDIRFDAGLSGIGYALSYLIRNKFVDADFDELFQIQHNIIVNEFVRQDYESMGLKDLMQQWQLIPYFHYVPCCKASCKIQKLHKKCIDKFNIEWEKFREDTHSIDKEFIISLWILYLRVLPFVDGQKSYQHVYEYLKLVKDGFIKRDIMSLYYISNIGCICAEEMIESCISDFYPIDFLSLKNLLSEPYISHDRIRDYARKLFDGVSVSNLEEKLTRRLGYSFNSASLSAGVSGLILGLIGMETLNNRRINEIMSII